MPNTTNPNDAIQASQDIPAKKSDKFIQAYANAAHVEVTAWDFNVLFGELQRTKDGIVVEQTIGVRMSPQHAKAFAAVLVNNIKEYEKHVGEIKLPQAEPAEAASAAAEPKSNLPASKGAA